MKEKIPARQLIPCPFCGASSYGYVGEKDHTFCKSCNRDLTEAAKAYFNAIKTIEKIKAEGRKPPVVGEDGSVTTVTDGPPITIDGSQLGEMPAEVLIPSVFGVEPIAQP